VTAVSLSTVKLLKDLAPDIEFGWLNTVKQAEALKVAPAAASCVPIIIIVIVRV
jgi:hypothetical protein